MNISVEEYTSIDPTTIDLNESLDFAMKTMSKKCIRHLLVEEDGKIVGIISERDLLANFGKTWSSNLRVKEIMKTDLLYAYTKDNLSDVALRLAANKVGSAIILDSDDSIYGIFTTTDALNALVEIKPS